MVCTDHEVQVGGAGSGSHVRRCPVPVGVDRVQMRIAAVPASSPAGDLLRGVLRMEGSHVRAEVQCDCDRVVQAVFADLVGTEHHVPGALCDGPRQISRGGFRGTDGELGAEPTGPTTESFSPDRGAILVKDADIAGITH